jgi:hypothetical protein
MDRLVICLSICLSVCLSVCLSARMEWMAFYDFYLENKM